MSYATHCDADSCDSWQRLNSEFPEFLELVEGDESVAHFCCIDCVMKWAAANSDPVDVVDM